MRFVASRDTVIVDGFANGCRPSISRSRQAEYLNMDQSISQSACLSRVFMPFASCQLMRHATCDCHSTVQYSTGGQQCEAGENRANVLAID